MFNLFRKKPIKKKPRCGHCNSSYLKKGYYNRGYNNLCKQAIGDHGYFCNTCCNISWITTYDEASRKAPEWCIVCESTTTIINQQRTK